MWLYPANELLRQWHAYYVPKDRLYIFQNNRYDHHLPLELEFDLDVHDSDLVLPLDALQVSAEATEDFWEIIGPVCHMLIPAAPIVPGSFQEFLTSLEPLEASLFHTIELRHPPHKIVRYLTEETFLGVSNGAEKFKCAAFGWVLSRSNGRRLVRCAGPVYGADPPSSFRAEGYGFLAMLRFLL